MSKHLPLFTAFLLTAACGYLLGRIVDTTIAQKEPTMIVDDERSPVPTVELEGVWNGSFRGSIEGEARFILGETAVTVDSEGLFQVPAESFLVNNITIEIPEGMHFVASRRGSKYYPVLSSRGEAISPSNRVYFATAAEAEEAGYTP